MADVLLRASQSEIMQRLNAGDPWKMGESIGVSEAHALARGQQLQNVCLWCDEFFGQYLADARPDNGLAQAAIAPAT